MKAATIDRFKTPATVREVDIPTLDEDAILLRITAAGVNPVDWKVRDGQAGDRPFPLTLGEDFAGIVERTGTAVTRVREGDRVFGTAREHGSYAEFTEIRDGVHDSPFTRIPAGISDAQAAAIPIPVLTALASLEALHAGRGTELLVVGAAGAVGSAVLQIARNRGAATTALVKPGQENDARAYGATIVVTMTNDPQAAVAVKHEDPFDAVIDLVSDGEKLKAFVPLVKRGGAILTTIHVADEAYFAGRGLTAINLAMPESPQSSPAALDEAAQMVLDGKLTVSVSSERPLEEANAVLDELKAGTLHGKVVLRP